MIDHNFSQCQYCGTKIFLRFQMGYFDIPFDFCCPNCGVHIHGVRYLVDKCSLIIHNASVIESEIDDMEYYADFSVELPHKKISKLVSFDQIALDGFGPFMAMTRMFDGNSYQILLDKMGKFLSFRRKIWDKTLPLYDLYYNNKIDLASEHFLKLGKHFIVKNKLDACMALHQTTILGFNNIMQESTLQKFSKLGEDILRGLNIFKIYEFISYLGGEEYFISLLKRLIKIFSRWIEDFEKHIPMVMLSLGEVKDKFNFQTHGIATASFEDMKSFYSDSYELILDMVEISIGLNNISHRGGYNMFNNTAEVTCFDNYRKKAKSERLKAIISGERYSKEIIINKKVRNAIAHYDYDFEPSSQIITFIDKYKNKENIVKLYLADLSLLCYDNIVILVYLSELMYSLRKIDYTIKGHKPNIGHI